MTLFEYLAAAHTLILTFAAARILSGMPYALKPGRLFWVHVSWVALAIWLCLMRFWAFWGYREVEWSLPRLIICLAPPALIYVFSSLLAPPDPSGVPSWREHFFRVRASLFASGVFLVASILFNTQTLLGVSPMHTTSIILYSTLAIFAIGAISATPWLHTVLALWPPLVIASNLVFMAQPDWFAR